jgi:leucyl aminopeptidase
VATALEEGKRLARDIGGADPEAGCPEKCVEMIRESLQGVSSVALRVVEAEAEIRTAFPLFAAVARASFCVPRHRPRIVRLEYNPADGGAVDRQVYLVGKGVVYDTGGADVKTGGHMAGMSRDKCGAAVVAGFVRTAAALQTPGLRIVAYLAFVRNSVGSDSYVADEIITARSGQRVLVVNTDAEGRMAMGDLLCAAREEAVGQPAASRPRTSLHTVATLTGHAMLTWGPGYTAAVENGPALLQGLSAGMKAKAEAIGDPLEHYTVRKEDWAYVAAKTPEYDVYQCGTAPSAATPRGHQFPAAFLMRVAGLDKHGQDSTDPLPYAHLDVAGSTVDAPFGNGVVNGNPVPMLVAYYCNL